VTGLLTHGALYYTSPADYLAGVIPFIEAGLTAGEPSLVYAPAHSLDLVRAGLHGSIDRVTLLDAADLARNPARIIPAVRAWAETHQGRRVRVVGEPIWPGRTEASRREAIRHEALVNVLFADVSAIALCPYDTAGLDAETIAAAGCTHPHLHDTDEGQQSDLYTDPFEVLSATEDLPAAPDDAETITFGHGDLAALREVVKHRAAGLDEDRRWDLVVGVDEAACNTLEHTDRPGTLRIWNEPSAVVFEVADSGQIPSPHLAGRIRPAPDALRGRGLWIMNQLCDLVELRSGPAGTVIRIHASIA
jgi:anti-sigma regulatory factor (Ser/Thr protein kinase)